MRLQILDNQTGSVACGVCPSFTAGCLVVWDFSTALEMTVASSNNQIVRLKRVLSKFFLLIMWKIVQIEFHSIG